MWHDNETSNDLIGFRRFAKAIASLATTEDILPVTMGVFGDWGSGKSSVLKMLQEELEDEEGVVTLWFDGWAFDAYDDPKAALMSAIVHRLESHASVQDVGILQKVQSKANSLIRRIKWFRTAGLATKGILTVTSAVDPAVLAGVALAEELGTVAENALKEGEAEATGAIDYGGVYDAVSGFRSDFEALVAESGVKSFVVLIDDLDRCLPDAITSTLEAIKLFLAVPKTAFVIAADERIVRQAVARRYPPESYQGSDLAQEYLDKMVQIPVVLPRMDETETETYIYLLFSESHLEGEALSSIYTKVRENRQKRTLVQPLNIGIARECLGDDADALEGDFEVVSRIAPILAKNLEGNPRLVKRFLNAFSLRVRLAEAEEIQLDQGALAKLMVLERFHQTRFDLLFRWQAQQQGVPGQLTSLEAFEEVEDGDGVTWLEDSGLREWLELEPMLAGVDLRPYFYLARETLRVKTPGVRRLSQNQQELYAKLQAGSQAVRRSGAEELVRGDEQEVSVVIDALLARVKANPRDRDAFDGALEVGLGHEPSAGKIIELLQQLPTTSIESRSVPRLSRLGQKWPELVARIDEMLTGWSTSSSTGLAGAAKAVLKANQG